MKKNILTLISCVLFIQLNAQDLFTVPQLTNDQKQEVLYNHVMAYAITGISFAKSKDTSPEDYGRYIGNQFKPFWDPDDGFSVFVNRMIYILSGLHPDNEMQIVKQSEKMIKFRLKNVDLMFKEGPAFGITYDELLSCSYGIISTLADYMGVTFSHNMTEDGWYVVIMKAK